jgi:hypothetical protein
VRRLDCRLPLIIVAPEHRVRESARTFRPAPPSKQLMELLPSSPRQRRRLAWAGGAGTAVVALVLVAVLLPDRNSRIDGITAAAPVGKQAAAGKQAPATTIDTPRETKLTRRERLRVTDALDRFILTGVAGKNADDAWELTTGALHAGSQRSDWAKGETPFWRFPAQGRHFGGWVLKYSYPGDVGLDVLLQPKPGADTGPISFRAELKRIGGHWLVEAWQPMAMFSKPGARAQVLAQPDLAPSIVGTGEQRISATWLFLPHGLLAGAIVLIPVAIAVSTWRKNRAVARYLEDERVRRRRAA